jgi:hypothetical protein
MMKVLSLLRRSAPRSYLVSALIPVDWSTRYKHSSEGLFIDDVSDISKWLLGKFVPRDIVLIRSSQHLRMYLVDPLPQGATLTVR